MRWHNRRQREAGTGWQSATAVQTARRAPASGSREVVARASTFVASNPSQIALPALASKEGVLPSEGPIGHRERMRDRLLNRAPRDLADYELLEILLFFTQPKGDTKPLAKRLINRFGSYGATLTADRRDLEAIQGVGRHTVVVIKLMHACSIRLLQAEVMSRPVLGNWDRFMGYLNAITFQERIEQFRVLYLDKESQVLADELQGKGTVNHTPVYPREVARRALEHHAAAVILVHNHPSGDPTPSEADVEVTKQIAEALRALNVRLHDHVIVGNNTWLSLRREGLL